MRKSAGKEVGAGKAGSPTQAILRVLKSIPKGKVASYGQVAALAGYPRGARQVARLLHSLSRKERLPWHRVVNREGRISLPMRSQGADFPDAVSAGALQAALLRQEGLAVDKEGRVDIGKYAWRPKA